MKKPSRRSTIISRALKKTTSGKESRIWENVEPNALNFEEIVSKRFLSFISNSLRRTGIHVCTGIEYVFPPRFCSSDLVTIKIFACLTYPSFNFSDLTTSEEWKALVEHCVTKEWPMLIECDANAYHIT